jgi:hypothetical protein
MCSTGTLSTGTASGTAGSSRRATSNG